ncbi:unnamed protein product [Discula destructiva]
MSCLQNSTYTQGDESDQGWFLYNLRYSFDYCVFGYPNGTGSGSNPCETSTACGNLQNALEYDSLSPNNSVSNEFGYCDADGSSVTGRYYQACLNCVSASGDAIYIANSLVALEAGCAQRPNATELLGLSDSIFSASLVTIVDPSTLNKSSDATTLSTAALAGIAAGGAAVLLIVAAIIFVRCRRRKNRAKVGLRPRWGKDKRRSSFSFKCRNILASPLSPKFFTDLPPVEEQQPYGSLEQQMACMSTINRGSDGRYYIESKPVNQSYPYESSLDGRRTRDTSSSVQSTLVPEQWEDLYVPKKRGISKMSLMTIDTTQAGLSPPPATHHSPKANEFNISPSTTRVAPAVNPTNYASANYTPRTSSPAQSFQRSSPKPKTTTMSSQGSGYPSSRRSPQSESPQVQQYGWPSARSAQEPWFAPPPGSETAPSKYGRKVSLGAVGSTSKRGKRESGSPVESKQIRVAFPAPPQR